MEPLPQAETESQSERIRNLELKVVAMTKEPDVLRAEFRATVLESEMRMKEYVDQRFVRLEARENFHFKILMSMQAATFAGMVAIAVRLLFMP